LKAGQRDLGIVEEESIPTPLTTGEDFYKNNEKSEINENDMSKASMTFNENDMSSTFNEFDDSHNAPIRQLPVLTPSSSNKSS
jgi:uncharacterized protein YdaT